MARPLAQLFPWPFVGVVVLLVVLVLITPNLLSSGAGPAAGSLAAQAELVIDRTVDNATVHLYVHGVGMVRYTSISIAWITNLSWPPPAHLSPANWTNRSWVNNTLGLVATSGADPLAVNVTAIYVDPSGQVVWYVGAYAFHVASDLLFTTDLAAGAAPVTPTAIANLPIAFPLTGVAPGGSA